MKQLAILVSVCAMALGAVFAGCATDGERPLLTPAQKVQLTFGALDLALRNAEREAMAWSPDSAVAEFIGKLSESAARVSTSVVEFVDLLESVGLVGDYTAEAEVVKTRAAVLNAMANAPSVEAAQQMYRASQAYYEPWTGVEISEVPSPVLVPAERFGSD